MNMRSLIINYKAYEEGVDDAVEIARISASIAHKYNVKVIVSPPLSVLEKVSAVCESIAQMMHPIDPGAFTGHVSWYEIKKAGAAGALINHSENHISYEEIDDVVRRCKEHGLSSYVCCADIDEAKRMAKLSPTAIAYEPTELIGGNVSVSKAEPEIVGRFVKVVKAGSSSKALIGAGIKTAEDVKKSVELGSDGILVASGIMKAKDYEKSMEELAGPLGL